MWAQFPGELLEPRPLKGSRESFPLPTRVPVSGPEPTLPVVYRDDQETLRRVIDALRGLDTWPLPDRTAGRVPGLTAMLAKHRRLAAALAPSPLSWLSGGGAASRRWTVGTVLGGAG